VQQGDRDPGGVGLAVVFGHQAGAGAAAAFAGQHHHEHHVRDRGRPGQRRDPGGCRRRFGEQQADRPAVALGQPDPGTGRGEQAGHLRTQGGQRVRAFHDGAEVRVVADHLQAQPGRHVGVRWAGPADPQPVVLPG